jgi:hypothetical protein
MWQFGTSLLCRHTFFIAILSWVVHANVGMGICEFALSLCACVTVWKRQHFLYVYLWEFEKDYIFFMCLCETESLKETAFASCACARVWKRLHYLYVHVWVWKRLHFFDILKELFFDCVIHVFNLARLVWFSEPRVVQDLVIHTHKNTSINCYM